MSALHQVEQLLPALSRAEKAQLLRLVAQALDDAFPGIDSTPGVCGGEPPLSRRADQRYAGASGGTAEVVIERGERQTLANCQFEVGGIIGAKVVCPRQRKDLLSEPCGGAMFDCDRQ